MRLSYHFSEVLVKRRVCSAYHSVQEAQILPYMLHNLLRFMVYDKLVLAALSINDAAKLDAYSRLILPLGVMLCWLTSLWLAFLSFFSYVVRVFPRYEVQYHTHTQTHTNTHNRNAYSFAIVDVVYLTLFALFPMTSSRVFIY